jgi:hypothetical protein
MPIQFKARNMSNPSAFYGLLHLDYQENDRAAFGALNCVLNFYKSSFLPSILPLVHFKSVPPHLIDDYNQCIFDLQILQGSLLMFQHHMKRKDLNSSISRDIKSILDSVNKALINKDIYSIFQSRNIVSSTEKKACAIISELLTSHKSPFVMKSQSFLHGFESDVLIFNKSNACVLNIEIDGESFHARPNKVNADKLRDAYLLEAHNIPVHRIVFGLYSHKVEDFDRQIELELIKLKLIPQ